MIGLVLLVVVVVFTAKKSTNFEQPSEISSWGSTQSRWEATSWSATWKWRQSKRTASSNQCYIDTKTRVLRKGWRRKRPVSLLYTMYRCIWHLSNSTGNTSDHSNNISLTTPDIHSRVTPQWSDVYISLSLFVWPVVLSRTGLENNFTKHLWKVYITRYMTTCIMSLEEHSMRMENNTYIHSQLCAARFPSEGVNEWMNETSLWQQRSSRQWKGIHPACSRSSSVQFNTNLATFGRDAEAADRALQLSSHWKWLSSNGSV